MYLQPYHAYLHSHLIDSMISVELKKDTNQQLIETSINRDLI